MLSSQQVVLSVPSFIHGETGADLARNLPIVTQQESGYMGLELSESDCGIESRVIRRTSSIRNAVLPLPGLFRE